MKAVFIRSIRGSQPSINIPEIKAVIEDMGLEVSEWVSGTVLPEGTEVILVESVDEVPQFRQYGVAVCVMNADRIDIYQFEGIMQSVCCRRAVPVKVNIVGVIPAEYVSGISISSPFGKKVLHDFLRIAAMEVVHDMKTGECITSINHPSVVDESITWVVEDDSIVGIRCDSVTYQSMRSTSTFVKELPQDTPFAGMVYDRSSLAKAESPDLEEALASIGLLPTDDCEAYPVGRVLHQLGSVDVSFLNDLDLVPIYESREEQYGWDDSIYYIWPVGFLVFAGKLPVVTPLTDTVIERLREKAYQRGATVGEARAEAELERNNSEGHCCSSCGAPMTERRDYTHGCGDICYMCS